MHVKDLARAIYRAGIEEAAAGMIFNITDGMNDTWSDFLHAIGSALGKEITILPVPPLLFNLPARFFDLFAGIAGSTVSPEAFVSYVTTDLLFTNDSRSGFSIGSRNIRLRWVPKKW